MVTKEEVPPVPGAVVRLIPATGIWAICLACSWKGVSSSSVSFGWAFSESRADLGGVDEVSGSAEESCRQQQKAPLSRLVNLPILVVCPGD